MKSEQVQQDSLHQQSDNNYCYQANDYLLVKHNDVYFKISNKQSKEMFFFDEVDHDEYSKLIKNIKQNTKYCVIYGITQIGTRNYIILVTETTKVGKIMDSLIYQANKFRFIQLSNSFKEPETLIKHHQNVFSLLNFYFSDYDLTQRLQHNHSNKGIGDTFFCNYHYTNSYQNYPSKILTKFIFGFAKTKQIIFEDIKYQITLISRGNWHSVSRRWMRRGIIDGHATMHYESELVFDVQRKNQRSVFSSVQMRGSLPILWSQTPDLSFKAPVSISKDKEKTRKQLNEYLESQEKIEGKIKIISLLSKKGGQGSLCKPLEEHLLELDRNNTSLYWFDYNIYFRNYGAAAFNIFSEDLRSVFDDFEFCKFTKNKDSNKFTMVKEQKGIFRTNCMHCLDRTNFIQYIISRVQFLNFLDEIYDRQKTNHYPFDSFNNQQLQNAFKELWMENGNVICYQNSGSGALKLIMYHSGKRGIKGWAQDAYPGFKRYFMSIFKDSYHQNCLDLHFKKLLIKDNTAQVNNSIVGNKYQPFLLLSWLILIVVICCYGFNYVKDKSSSNLWASISTLGLGVMGIFAMRFNSDNLINRPILRFDPR